ncbi:hypothetical protein GIS00_07550 [Nakamurella sp. YIM 132087]|uniref:Uncharacterized protein n=1 Tax=Nakamurella alba TaxID=2665158 RepID=A0A7K1FI97_9ACTN|nr:hypothetical protein [Nakamurella alba]MTD13796.1 hypothetical protein [Nakamurella alba]
MQPSPFRETSDGLRRRRARVVTGTALAGSGVVGTVLGAFLPWVRSGSVDRNSFELSGVASRLLFPDGLVSWLLSVWPLIGPLCAVPVVLALLRLWRSAGAMSVVLGAITIALSVTVQVMGGDRAVAGIGLVRTGPVVLAVGGLLLVLGGVVLLTVRRVTGRSRDALDPPTIPGMPAVPPGA